MFTLRTADLRKLNSLTKYPSIPTHHALDPKNGGLLEEPTAFTGTVIGTEKIDGCSGRIVFLPDGTWLIGSREDLLTAGGDIVCNPSLGIVDALRDLAASADPTRGDITVFYLEVYGSKQLPAWKHYGAGEPAFRLFDAATVGVDMLGWDIAKIASWRQRGGQTFVDEDALREACWLYGAELTPRLFEIDASDLPADIEGMRAFLEPYKTTTVATSGEPGACEGIVLRAADRSVITKVRFQDYNRTLKRRQKGAGERSRPVSA